MRRYVVAVLLVAMFCSGCMSMPTQQEIANFDYGAPLTFDYRSAIKDYFSNSLFDPYSAMYEFESPQKAWYKDMSGLRIGYLVITSINAKNRFGAYVGKERYGFLFRDNKILRVLNSYELNSMQFS